MNASSDRKKPPAESQRHSRESRHPHKYRTRPTAKVEPHRISDHREASVRRAPDVPHRGVKYFNWYPASSSTEDNEDTFNLDVRSPTEGDIPQWQDSPSCVRTRVIPEISSVHRDLPLPPLAQPCTAQPKPCTTTLVNESSHPEEFLLGVRLPISLISTSPLSARPPRPASKRPRNKPAAGNNENVLDHTPVSGNSECASTVELSESLHSSAAQASSSIARQPSTRETEVLNQQEVDPTEPVGTHVEEQNKAEPEKPASIRHTRLKVAFVEPTEKQERSPTKVSSTDPSLSRPAPTILRSSAGNTTWGTHKLSPSAQFPGWGVITDDEDEETVKDAGSKTTGGTETIANTEREIVESVAGKTETTIAQPITVEEGTNNGDVVRRPLVVTVEDVETSSSPEPDGKEVPTSYSHFNSRPSRVVTEKERFQIQQEFLRQNALRDLAPPRPSGSAMLRQPRKSLAMIFNNLSNNLGFIPKNSSKTATSSPVQSQVTLAPTDQEQSTPSSIPPSVRASLMELTGSKLLKDRRGHSTLIQIGKTDSTEQNLTYINGDVCRRPERGRLGTLIGTSSNRGSETNPTTIANFGAQRAYLQGDTTAERSLIVDLLCCTCCTKVEEEEAYANLIENHRLARVITLAAVLTILGLILAYIIRSAIEAPQSDQTNTPPVPAAINLPSVWGQADRKVNTAIHIERIRLPEADPRVTVINRNVSVSSTTTLPVTDTV